MRFTLICILLLLFVFAWAKKSMEEDFEEEEEEEEEGSVCTYAGHTATFPAGVSCKLQCPGTCS